MVSAFELCLYQSRTSALSLDTFPHYSHFPFRFCSLWRASTAKLEWRQWDVIDATAWLVGLLRKPIWPAPWWNNSLPAAYSTISAPSFPPRATCYTLRYSMLWPIGYSLWGMQIGPWCQNNVCSWACVTPQTQRGPKHEKYILKVSVDFSFLENQTIGDLCFPFISTW